MEKAQELKQGVPSVEANKSLVWDCDSSLYDSFELKSFTRQLDSAITSTRTLSMPRLSDHHRRAPPPPPPPSVPVSKKSSKISRSFHKLLKSVFGSKANNGSLLRPQDRLYVHDRSHVLSTIPEDVDYAGLSPEVNSLARRTASDRFTATSMGISCA
ncbi:hypothetical protein L1049_022690 [Liquidambar formosana]|uniref:Uncharacterized protein n=1 Tax=Liquidambar formosana TaxID=63359 RepID=A0AAP0WRW9_LIQFO